MEESGIHIAPRTEFIRFYGAERGMGCLVLLSLLVCLIVWWIPSFRCSLCF